MQPKPKLKLLTLLLRFTFTFTLFSCSNPTQPPQKKNNGILTLSLEEVSSTEAWVNLKAQNVPLPAEINILLDSKALTNINLASGDTTVYIDSLLPNRSYRLEARFTDNTGTAKSNPLTIATLDTTSHNFIWQKYTFGVGASSIFRDVAIIDENNIWAVGEIYMNDSTGKPDPLPYNAVHWDGSKWEVKRITTEFRGNLITVPLEGIYAFSATDIWMVGSLPIHWDGKSWTMYDVRTTTDPNLSLSKAWGSNSNDMYFVGRSGSIAHYNGTSWQKIESGTDLPINDIYGDVNPFTGEKEILSVAAYAFEDRGVRVISIKEDNTTEKLDNTGFGRFISSVWFSAGLRYYIVGSGLYEKTYEETSTWRDLNQGRSITQNFMEGIRGNGLNDIIVVGAYGEVLHYNGLRWKSLKNGETTLNNGSYYKIAVKGNIVAAVGYDGNKAIILIGKR